MGLSASQARFLALTARKSNVEYQAQQINAQRLQLADKLAAVSDEYREKTSNMKLQYSYNDGTGVQSVDLTYKNYKNYMNQQLDGLSTTQSQYFLVSSSGNKIIVASEQERDEMIESFTTYTFLPPVDVNIKETSNEVSDQKDEEPQVIIQKEDEEGNLGNYLVKREYTENDFLIVDDLNNVDNFQDAIKNGIYYFATRQINSETNKFEFKASGWDNLGNEAITEVYDRSDDVAAEAKYETETKKYQKLDKELELQTQELESERTAIETEIESVSKVIEGNIEKSFNTFG